jgi:DNA sulfur modification protein DndD
VRCRRFTGGANGSGKTTLVESLKLCLFGKKGTDLSSKKYQDYIIDSKNRSSTKQGDRSFFIETDIEVDDNYPPYNIRVKREWLIQDDKSVDERFNITRDGEQFQIVPSEYWEDYILSIIPPYISDYFFFDGERVKELSTGDKADRILRESIRDLIGLKSYEILYKDLEVLKGKILKRNAEHSKLNSQFKEIEANILSIESEIAESKKLIKINYLKTSEIKNNKYGLEEELRRKAGAFADKRKNLEKSISSLNEKLNYLNEDIKQISGDYLPFIIASKTCKTLLDQLSKERILKELKSSKATMLEINNDLIGTISQNSNLKRHLNNDQLGIIIEEINGLFIEKLSQIEDRTQVPMIHDLSLTDSFKIEEFIKNIDKNIRTNFRDLLRRREEIVLKLDKCHKELNRVPKDSFIGDYVEKISSIDAEIKGLSKEIESLNKNIPALEAKKIQFQKKLKDLNMNIICVEEDDKKIEEYVNKATSLKLHDLENKINFMYHLLANKGDMIDQIKIEPDNFASKILGYHGELIKKESISAGEKEIYALSILWGLAKISDKKMPMIIDSPLAKLDTSHVNKIIDNFFPNAAENVIILSHDREIDETLYNRLKPRINRSYTLSLNESNKINEGYFF